MPDVDDDRPAGGIEVLAAVGVADRRTVCFDGDGRVGQGRTAEHGAGAHARMLADGAAALPMERPRPGRCRKYGGAVEGRPTEDAEAIARARGGDVAAYEELVRRYQDVALRTAYLVCPETDADDAVQEAFLKAYAALPRFRDGAPFRPWLLRIVANEARNRRRSAGRRTGLAQRAADVAGPAVEPSPEHGYLAAEERTALFAAINTLRDEDREVIGARFLLELSEAETAEALGIPRGTVKSRTSRALGRLRAGARRSERGDPWLSSASSSFRTTSWAPCCAASLRP